MPDCINMTGRELRAWASDPRHGLTGEKEAAGRLSLHGRFPVRSRTTPPVKHWTGTEKDTE